MLFEQRLPLGGVHLFWPSQMSEGTPRRWASSPRCCRPPLRPGRSHRWWLSKNRRLRYIRRCLPSSATPCSKPVTALSSFVTTHSADLLDNKDVETDSLLAVTADEGATHIAPINADGRELIRQRLYTAGELLRIGQLLPDSGLRAAPTTIGLLRSGEPREHLLGRLRGGRHGEGAGGGVLSQPLTPPGTRAVARGSSWIRGRGATRRVGQRHLRQK